MCLLGSGLWTRGQLAISLCVCWASQVVLVVKKKNPPADAGYIRDEGSIPGWEDPLRKSMATHSTILAQRIPMDRGTWQATVHWVTKSQTQLSN